MNTTEVVAIVTGASTLLAGTGGVVLTSYLGSRAARHLARSEAYESLATAVHIAAFRASAIHVDGSATQADLTAAFEKIVAADAAVHIRGSKVARSKSEVLARACSAFVAISMRTSGPLNATELPTATDAVMHARDDFLNLARREERSRRLPR